MRLLQPEFFRRYDVSTLFYVFFYFPGSSQQSFAGRELKQRGWRFHTKYQTWFHRVSPPSETTAAYEVGTFEYFDHTGPEPWIVRERRTFKLEYEHTETE
jgi:CCR4-NOT transcription complex subunit 3